MLRTAADSVDNVPPSKPRKFLRIRDVVERTGLPPSSIYQKMSEGSFPKSLSLGPRCKAWLEEEIVAWQDARLAEREGRIIA